MLGQVFFDEIVFETDAPHYLRVCPDCLTVHFAALVQRLPGPSQGVHLGRDGCVSSVYSPPFLSAYFSVSLTSNYIISHHPHRHLLKQGNSLTALDLLFSTRPGPPEQCYRTFKVLRSIRWTVNRRKPCRSKRQVIIRGNRFLSVACSRASRDVVVLGHRSKASIEVFNSLAVSLFDHASNLLALCTNGKR